MKGQIFWERTITVPEKGLEKMGFKKKETTMLL